MLLTCPSTVPGVCKTSQTNVPARQGHDDPRTQFSLVLGMFHIGILPQIRVLRRLQRAPKVVKRGWS